ncbi:MAG: alpha/beta fold hydrolase [Pseudomonas sp.]|uniref:alpha/beta fold hydrolase n=1 Tax=Pseudomonas sp. TaxID=306 RepID=UPI00391B1D31
MTVAKHLVWGCLCLAASLGHAEPLIKPTAIDWLLDCPLPAAERLDPDVLARTQCGIVSVPRDHTAPGQGNRRLYVTRVGARDPLSREGVVFAQAGDPPQRNAVGTFAIQLASHWGASSAQAYRTLLNRYDVIELSSHDLSQDKGVEQAARDMEFVRVQLGDPQLHYLGNAAATRLGDHYAALFPERIARMVLVNGEGNSLSAPQVEQLHLKEPTSPGTSGCAARWIGVFLAYGKRPPASTRCVDSGVGR